MTTRPSYTRQNQSLATYATSLAVVIAVLLNDLTMFTDGRWLTFIIGILVFVILVVTASRNLGTILSAILLIAQTLTVIFLIESSQWFFLTPMLTFVTVSSAQMTLPRRWANGLAVLLTIIIGILFAISQGLAAGVQAGLGFAAGFVFIISFTRIAQSEIEARDELAQAHQQLGEYAAQVERLATARERNRLAREVHDSLGHYLTTLNVQLEIAIKLFDSDPGRAREATFKAKQLATEGLEQVRRSVAALRPSPLDDVPLEQAIRNLANEAQSAGLNCAFTQTGTRRPLSPDLEIVVYRIAQESLTNIRKHAKAHHAEIQLNYETESVHIYVRDDGVGRQNSQDGIGLSGLRERVQAIGGKIWTENHREGGFVVEATLPSGAQING